MQRRGGLSGIESDTSGIESDTTGIGDNESDSRNLRSLRNKTGCVSIFPRGQERVEWE